MQEELKLARERADREVGCHSFLAGIVVTFVLFGLSQMAADLWKRWAKGQR